MSIKIKERLQEESQEHNLTDYEYAFIQELTVLLQFHTEQKRIMSNLLTYIAQNRLGYTYVREGYNLLFDIKDNDGHGIVIVKEVKE